MRDFQGHFSKAREWLFQFMLDSSIKNETLSLALVGDWSAYSKAQSAYVLGVVWGRLRQIKSELEEAQDYATLVIEELNKTKEN